VKPDRLDDEDSPQHSGNEVHSTVRMLIIEQPFPTTKPPLSEGRMQMKRRKRLSCFGLPLLLAFLLVSIPSVMAGQPTDNDRYVKSESISEMPGVFWEGTYGCPHWDWCYDVIEVSTGGFAMTGFHDSTWAGQDGKMWLVRTDSNGTLLWNRTYRYVGNPEQSSGQSLLECSDGGFAIGGYMTVYVQDTDTRHSEIWLVRTDAEGNQLWNRTYGGSGGDTCVELAGCSDGGFALFGITSSRGAGGSDFFLVRVDADGDMLWNHTYGYSGNEFPGPDGLVQCSDGGFAMVGNTWSLGLDAQVLLVRTDSDGNQLWSETYGESNWELGFDILNVDSDFLILAQRTDTVQQTSWAWVIRTDSDGDVIWERLHGAGIGESIVQCSSGGFAIAGYGGDMSTGIGGGWLVRIDDDGNLLWDRIYNRSDRDEFHEIIECSDGNFAMAGQTEVDWDAGDFEFWLLRVADQAPPIPIEWIVIGVGVPIAAVAILALLRAKRK